MFVINTIFYRYQYFPEFSDNIDIGIFGNVLININIFKNSSSMSIFFRSISIFIKNILLPKMPDIDISKNVLSDIDMKVLIAIDICVPIDINIFKNGLVDIDIIKNCQYIDDGYG